MSDQSNSSTSVKTESRPFVKLALEFGPLLLFFLANSQGDRIVERIPFFAELEEPIYFATAVFMVAILVSLAFSLYLTRQVPVMPVVTAVFVLVFGALTLLLQDDLFIKLKPTLINVLFGSILLTGLMFNKIFLKYVFDSAFKLDSDGWRKLTFRWGLFFYFLALTNEIVWRNFSTDAWVQFKVFGILPITLLFTLSQMPLMMRHGLKSEAERG